MSSLFSIRDRDGKMSGDAICGIADMRTKHGLPVPRILYTQGVVVDGEPADFTACRPAIGSKNAKRAMLRLHSWETSPPAPMTTPASEIAVCQI